MKGLLVLMLVVGLMNSVESGRCSVKCPEGQELVKRPGVFPLDLADGCGDAFEPTYPFDFTSCCDAHDFCYSICGRSKKKCDRDMDHCLKSLCDTKYSTTSQRRKECHPQAAELYDILVINSNCDTYQEFQGKACQCVDKVEKEEL